VKNYAVISILLMLLWITSCKKEETYTSNYDYGYTYFPDDSGRFVIYKVDSVLYNDFDRSVKYTSIFLKEKITDRFLDNMGRTAKKVLRFYSDTISIDTISTIWEQYNTNYIVKTSIVAERVEDNLRYIKMVFPNDVNKKWLGNKYITIPPPFVIDTTNYYLNDWKFTIKNRDKFFNDGVKSFDSSLLITQIQDSSAITKTYSVERYARNVGLIYKEMWMVSTQDSIKIRLQLPWEQRADKGFIVRQYAIAYGKE